MNKTKHPMKYPILTWLFVSISLFASAQSHVNHEIIVMLQPTATWDKFEHQLLSINNINISNQEIKYKRIEIKKVLS